MFLKKLLILVCLFAFPTILLSEDETQQYEYLTYTINVENNSGVDVNLESKSDNTALSTIIMKTGATSIEKTGELPIADVTSAVQDPSVGPTWHYLVTAKDKSFSCRIDVISDAQGVNYLKTTTTVQSNPDYETFCTLDCNETGVLCNDIYPHTTSKDTPHILTYTLTIAKP